MGAANSAQTAFRVRDDDDDETDATWLAALNTNWTQDVDVTFRLRMQISENNGGNFANILFKLQSNTEAGGYQDVTAASTNVKSVGSANTTWALTDEDATTEQLAGGQAFDAGIWDDDGATETLISLMSEDTELEFCIQLVGANLTDEDEILFRVVETDNTVMDDYDQTPTITANKAAVASTAIPGPVMVQGHSLEISGYWGPGYVA